MLFDKNEIFVLDMRTMKTVFRSTYRDASGQILRLFLILPKVDSTSPSVQFDSRFLDDEFVGSDDEE